MGLDLLIREQSNGSINNKGQRTYTVTELFNLRNCWQILEKLGDRLEGGFDNCGTYSFDEGTFHAILKQLQAEKAENPTSADLNYEINRLKEFINQEHLVEQEVTEEDIENGCAENYGRTFEVHAWW